MARFKTDAGIKTIEGSFGKFTTIKNWAGEEIIKEKITKMTNPRTGGQTQQRGKLGFMGALAKLLVLVIAKKLTRKVVQTAKGPKGLSARNIFVQENIKNVFPLGTDESFDPELIEIGTEDLTNPAYNSVTIADDGEVGITFVNNSTTGNASADDVIIMTIIDSEGTAHYYDDYTRASGARTANPTTAAAAGEAYVFLMCVTSEEFDAADSVVSTCWTNRYGFVNSQVLCLGSVEIA